MRWWRSGGGVCGRGGVAWQSGSTASDVGVGVDYGRGRGAYVVSGAVGRGGGGINSNKFSDKKINKMGYGILAWCDAWGGGGGRCRGDGSGVVLRRV